MDGVRLKPGSLLQGRYVVKEEIGEGSFGKIYSAEDKSEQRTVAIKVEPVNVLSPQLENEYQMYMRFQGAPNFPHVFAYFSDGGLNFLVFELLGKSIQSLFENYRRPFSLKTVLMVAEQMLSAVQYLHEKGIVHRDIKPENFMTGLGNKSSELFLIDFGLSKNYRNPSSREHCPFSYGHSLIGTARYASLNAMKGYEQSRRDDLESIGYLLIYLMCGNLPWQGLPANTAQQKYAKILEVKSSTTIDVLCRGLPLEFMQYLSDVKHLQYDDEPNYHKYRQMFKNLFIRNQFAFDSRYDWVANIVRPPQTPRQSRTQPATPRRSVRNVTPPCDLLRVLSKRSCHVEEKNGVILNKIPRQEEERALSIERKKIISPRKIITHPKKKISNFTYRRMNLGAFPDQRFCAANQISQ